MNRLMANMNAILKYEQLEELVTLIYQDIKKTATTEHEHSAENIIESTTKRFVSDSEKASWNARITQSQLDSALNTLASGLTWKGSFATLAEIQALQNPKDGWFAIATTGINTFYIYESEIGSWQDLGGLMLPDVATETSNGLMSKEMVIKLAELSNYTLPKATASVLGGVKSGTVITVDSNGVLQIDTAKIVTTTEKNTWNQAAADGAEALSEISKTNANVSNAITRVGNLETRATNIEGKLVYITSVDISSLVETSKS